MTAASSVYVIAEVGPNHNGDVGRALEMVRQLAAAGADAVKFQMGSVANVYSSDAFKADYQTRDPSSASPQEMAQKDNLTPEDHARLAAACRDAGVAYLCTAFDMPSLIYLDTVIGVDRFKIPSGEIHTVDMLEYIGATDRPVIMSTGMASFDDIAAGLRYVRTSPDRDITLLHCVSNYPTAPEDVHLNVMPELARRFGMPVGFSDHTLGNDCALAAVALGATIIEKHVTLDKSLPGPDHQASATVAEFGALVRSIRTVTAALGGREKVFGAEERGVREAARKSIVSARALRAGDVIGRDDVCFKRPGTGFSPLDLDKVVGKILKRDIAADRLVRPEDLGDGR